MHRRKEEQDEAKVEAQDAVAAARRASLQSLHEMGHERRRRASQMSQAAAAAAAGPSLADLADAKLAAQQLHHDDDEDEVLEAEAIEDEESKAPEEDEERAALRIEAAVRGYEARQHFKAHQRARADGAVTIEAAVRGYEARKHLREAKAARGAGAVKIESAVRGWEARKHLRDARAAEAEAAAAAEAERKAAAPPARGKHPWETYQIASNSFSKKGHHRHTSFSKGVAAHTHAGHDAGEPGVRPSMAVRSAAKIQQMFRARKQLVDAGVLEGVELFRACNLSRARLTQIARRLKLHEYRAGDVVCEEGEPGDSMFFVSSGTVGASVGGRHAADIGVHQYFGEKALAQQGGVRAATCTAKTDCVLFELTRATFTALFRGAQRNSLVAAGDKMLERAGQYAAPGAAGMHAAAQLSSLAMFAGQERRVSAAHHAQAQLRWGKAAGLGSELAFTHLAGDAAALTKAEKIAAEKAALQRHHTEEQARLGGVYGTTKKQLAAQRSYHRMVGGYRSVHGDGHRNRGSVVMRDSARRDKVNSKQKAARARRASKPAKRAKPKSPPPKKRNSPPPKMDPKIVAAAKVAVEFDRKKDYEHAIEKYEIVCQLLKDTGDERFQVNIDQYQRRVAGLRAALDRAHPSRRKEGHTSTRKARAGGGDGATYEWLERVDPKSGRTYYVNPKTSETRWTKPTVHKAEERYQRKHEVGKSKSKDKRAQHKVKIFA